MNEADPRETLPRSARIRSRKAFARVFTRQLRLADRRIILYAAQNDEDVSRLGISAGRRLGNAVQRNRIKRLVREAFRQLRHELPGGIDWVVVPKTGPEPTVAGLRQSLQKLTAQLQHKL